MAKRLLVVDDEENTVRLLEMNLRRAGYEVLKAYDGIQALQALEDTTPDLILLDVMMPRKDGFAVLQEIKADPERSTIPVMMLTAKALDEDLWHAVDTGAHYYITKPINPEELLGILERFFAEQQPE